jgi:hypothetical protein
MVAIISHRVRPVTKRQPLRPDRPEVVDEGLGARHDTHEEGGAFATAAKCAVGVAAADRRQID